MTVLRCVDRQYIPVFGFFVFASVILCGYSVYFGIPQRLYSGFDNLGNTCGLQKTPQKNSTLQKYAFFMDTSNPFKSIRKCVSECPNQRIQNIQKFLEFSQNNNFELCLMPPPANISTSPYIYGPGGFCPVLPIPKTEIFSGFCVPNARELVKMNISERKKIVSFLNFRVPLRFLLISDLLVGKRLFIVLNILSLLLVICLGVVYHFRVSGVILLAAWVTPVGYLVNIGIYLWIFIAHSLTIRENMRNQIPLFLVDVVSAITTGVLCTAFVYRLMFVLAASYATFRWHPVFKEFFEHITTALCSLRISLMVISFTLLSVFVIFFIVWTFIFLYLGSSVDVIPMGDELVLNHLQGTLYGVIHFSSLLFISYTLINIQRLVMSDLVLNWYYVIDSNDWRSNVSSCGRKIFRYYIGSAIAATIYFSLQPFCSSCSALMRNLSPKRINCLNSVKSVARLKHSVFFYIVSRNVGFYEALREANSMSALSKIRGESIDAVLNNLNYLVNYLPSTIMMMIATPFYKYYFFDSRYIYSPVFFIAVFCHFLFLSFASAVEVAGKVILAAVVVDNHFSNSSHQRHIKVELMDCLSKLNASIKLQNNDPDSGDYDHRLLKDTYASEV